MTLRSILHNSTHTRQPSRHSFYDVVTHMKSSTTTITTTLREHGQRKATKKILKINKWNIKAHTHTHVAQYDINGKTNTEVNDTSTSSFTYVFSSLWTCRVVHYGVYVCVWMWMDVKMGHCQGRCGNTLCTYVRV